LEIFFHVTLGSLGLLFSLTLIMTFFVAVITTFYVKYDEEAQTAGLTIWSIRQAKEWFKGRKLNEREGEIINVNWKLIESDDEDIINFSKKDMHKMAAEPGDLVYISDKRKWLGGLKSCHTVYGEPHNEDGIVYIRNLHIGKGLFVKDKVLEAEKEM
jgi:SSS family solute:Na+ symporter